MFGILVSAVLAATALTPDTIVDNIPGTATVREIVVAGGGYAGVGTNEVKEILETSFIGGTNAVNGAIVAIPALVTATNDLTESVANLNSATNALQTKVSNLESSKQDALNDAQTNAVNSGITSAKVEKYDGYEEIIEGKQDAIDDFTTTNAVRSLVDASFDGGTNAVNDAIATIPSLVSATNDLTESVLNLNSATNALQSKVSSLETSKQDALNDAQTNAVNSGITSAKVEKYDEYEELISGKQDAIDDFTTTNAVRSLVDSSFDGGTNAVNDAIATIPELVTATNNLTESVSSLSSSVSDLQSSKLDDDFVAMTNSVAFTNAVAHTAPHTDLGNYYTKPETDSKLETKRDKTDRHYYIEEFTPFSWAGDYEGTSVAGQPVFEDGAWEYAPNWGVNYDWTIEPESEDAPEDALELKYFWFNQDTRHQGVIVGTRSVSIKPTEDTFALTSEIPDSVDVIKQSEVTNSTPYGKAADAKDLKEQLAGKLDKTDVVAPTGTTSIAETKAAQAEATRQALNDKVPTSRKINGNALTNDIEITLEETDPKFSSYTNESFVALGYKAAKTFHGVSIGLNAKAGNEGVSIGNGATTNPNAAGTAISIGKNANGGLNGVAIGNAADNGNTDTGAVSIGDSAKSGGSQGIAIGYASDAKGGIAIGSFATVNNRDFNAVVIGTTESHGPDTINFADNDRSPQGLQLLYIGSRNIIQLIGDNPWGFSYATNSYSKTESDERFSPVSHSHSSITDGEYSIYANRDFYGLVTNDVPSANAEITSITFSGAITFEPSELPFIGTTPPEGRNFSFFATGSVIRVYTTSGVRTQVPAYIFYGNTSGEWIVSLTDQENPTLEFGRASGSATDTGLITVVGDGGRGAVFNRPTKQETSPAKIGKVALLSDVPEPYTPDATDAAFSNAVNRACKPLVGKTFDLSTNRGFYLAIQAILEQLGATVENPYSP